MRKNQDEDQTPKSNNIKELQAQSFRQNSLILYFSDSLLLFLQMASKKLIFFDLETTGLGKDILDCFCRVKFKGVVL